MDSAGDHKKAAVALPSSTSSQASYRDDQDALSMHTTRSDYEYDDVPELPAYADVVASESPPLAQDRPAPQEDEYRRIAQPTLNSKGGLGGRKTRCSSTVKISSETSIRMDENLMNPDRLYEYINNYLRYVPPQPMVRIRGTHLQQSGTGDGKGSKERVTDFDIVLNLQPFLPQGFNSGWWDAHTVDGGFKTFRGNFRKTRAEGFKQDIEVGHEAQNELDLKAWCETFCANKSWLRIFRIERRVTGLNTDFIKAHLEPLVRNTHYRGHIDISFPTADKNVDIYSPHWVNQARISWVRWIFYLTFLWLITWPILFFMTRRWCIYQVDWRFSRVVQNSSRDQLWKEYASISEEAWVQRHANLVQSLVLDKFQGDGTSFPTDVQVDPNARRNVRIPPVQLGRGGLHAATSILSSGMSAWRQMNGQENAGWGADEC